MFGQFKQGWNCPDTSLKHLLKISWFHHQKHIWKSPDVSSETTWFCLHKHRQKMSWHLVKTSVFVAIDAAETVLTSHQKYPIYSPQTSPENVLTSRENIWFYCQKHGCKCPDGSSKLSPQTGLIPSWLLIKHILLLSTHYTSGKVLVLSPQT